MPHAQLPPLVACMHTTSNRNGLWDGLRTVAHLNLADFTKYSECKPIVSDMVLVSLSVQYV